MNEDSLAGELLRLLEVGRKISAERRKKILAALSALQAVLAEEPTDEAAREKAFADAEALLEAELSFSDREQKVREALRLKFNPNGQKGIYTWMVDCYDSYAIASVEWNAYGADGAYLSSTAKTYKVSYSLLDGVITLGEPVEVKKVITYEPVGQQSEAAGDTEIAGDVVPLVEAKAVGKDGIAKVKVISPGQGTSGYYPPETLAKATAKFAGAQCYWDHPTATEEAARPERSLRDLAGKIVGTPVWEANGPTGPGIYADVQVFKPYQEAVQEMAPHIGMSIRALGKAKAGEVNGQKTRIVEGIETVKSVDFVTLPGRGGEILQLFEAARGGRANTSQEVSLVDEKEAQALREAKAAAEAENATLKLENARLKEASLLREAKDIVTETLAKVEMPDLTRARLTETLATKPVLKDGALDREAFVATIQEAAKAELEYLAKATGSGKITGMGSTGAGAGEPDKKRLVEAYKQTFLRQGETPERAAQLAEIAAR